MCPQNSHVLSQISQGGAGKDPVSNLGEAMQVNVDSTELEGLKV